MPIKQDDVIKILKVSKNLLEDLSQLIDAIQRACGDYTRGDAEKLDSLRHLAVACTPNPIASGLILAQYDYYRRNERKNAKNAARMRRQRGAVENAINAASLHRNSAPKARTRHKDEMAFEEQPALTSDQLLSEITEPTESTPEPTPEELAAQIAQDNAERDAIEQELRDIRQRDDARLASAAHHAPPRTEGEK